jgi:hypothetical protein
MKQNIQPSTLTTNLPTAQSFSLPTAQSFSLPTAHGVTISTFQIFFVKFVAFFKRIFRA